MWQAVSHLQALDKPYIPNLTIFSSIAVCFYKATAILQDVSLL